MVKQCPPIHVLIVINIYLLLVLFQQILQLFRLVIVNQSHQLMFVILPLLPIALPCCRFLFGSQCDWGDIYGRCCYALFYSTIQISNHDQWLIIFILWRYYWLLLYLLAWLLFLVHFLCAMDWRLISSYVYHLYAIYCILYRFLYSIFCNIQVNQNYCYVIWEVICKKWIICYKLKIDEVKQ